MARPRHRDARGLMSSPGRPPGWSRTLKPLRRSLVISIQVAASSPPLGRATSLTILPAETTVPPREGVVLRRVGDADFGDSGDEPTLSPCNRNTIHAGPVTAHRTRWGALKALPMTPHRSRVWRSAFLTT